MGLPQNQNDAFNQAVLELEKAWKKVMELFPKTELPSKSAVKSILAALEQGIGAIKIATTSNNYHIIRLHVYSMFKDMRSLFVDLCENPPQKAKK